MWYQSSSKGHAAMNFQLADKDELLQSKPLRFHSVKSGKEKRLPVFEDSLVVDENLSLRLL